MGEILRFDSVTSTNDVAKELIQKGGCSDTVIVAAHQTKGRGRFARVWHSPLNDGLYFSIIKDAFFDVKYSTLLGVAASLAIAEVLEKNNIIPGVKWPNDVLISGRKVSGVLVEKYGQSYIIGIGINVNNDISGFPGEINATATSMKIASGVDHDLNAVLMAVLECFDRYFAMIAAGNTSEILVQVRQRSVTIGTQIATTVSGEKLEGKALDIDESGLLIIELPNGKITKITSGDINIGN